MQLCSRPRFVIAALLLGGVFLLPHRAEAKCATPEAFFSPGFGEIVGPNPTVYFFHPKFWDAPPKPELKILRLIEVKGQREEAVAFTMTALPGTPAWAVWEVKIQAKKPGTLTLSWANAEGFSGRRTATVRISSDARKRPVTRLQRVYRKHFVWTCSNHAATHLETQMRPAAFRLEWATSPDEFARSTPVVAVFPASTEDFWNWKQEKPTGPGMLALGKLNCMDHSMPDANIALYARVTALYSDGRKSPVHAGLLHLPEDARGLALPASHFKSEEVSLDLSSLVVELPQPGALPAGTDPEVTGMRRP